MSTLDEINQHLADKHVVRGRGNPAAMIHLIGEAPGAIEDDKGIPFCGPSGQELERMCRAAGFTFNDCYIHNVIPYRPPQNKLQGLSVKPEFFHPLLDNFYSQWKPNIIVPLGNTALEAIYGDRRITKWRGSILNSKYNIKCLPTIHPADLFREWSWRNVIIWDLRRVNEESTSAMIHLPQRTFITRPTFDQAIDELIALRSAPELSIDIEGRANGISCIGLASSASHAICIPFTTANGSSYWNDFEEVEIWRELSQLLYNPNTKKIFQNASFDVAILYLYSLVVQGEIWDTMWMHNCLWPELPHGLDFQTSVYTREPYYKDDGKIWLRSIPENDFWIYNCKDAAVTFEIYQAETKELIQRGLLDFYKKHYLNLQPITIESQLFGWRLALRRRERMSITWTKYAIDAEKLLNTKAGIDVNALSPKQIMHLLYTHFNLPPQRHPRTGAMTVNEDALEKLKVKTQHPILDNILDVRAKRKFKSSYLDVEIDKDNRIRCSIGHTDHGRLKATKFLGRSGTNLQTIPEVGRSLFIAD